MAKNTAISAENEVQIAFNGKAHEDFFYRMLARCDNFDVYHQALAYCLGICEDVRRNIEQVFDFKTGCVNPDCLRHGWITSGSARVLRMAFNLYCNGTPSVEDMESTDEKLSECRSYAADDLFCCSYARYFWEAIKLRYPEYCNG